jgi:hypothetical protein
MKLTEREQRTVWLYCDECNGFAGILRRMESFLEMLIERGEKDQLDPDIIDKWRRLYEDCEELEKLVLYLSDGFGDSTDDLEVSGD